MRAPDIEFKASELGLEAFGYNIANTILVEALYARAQEILPAVMRGERHGDRLSTATRPSSRLSEGSQLAARLVAGADGRHSICRTSAGIGVTERRYDKSAIATSFRHTLPHRNVSTELHQERGSVTTVPLPDPHASSLIWVGSLAEIAALMRRDEAGFGDALAERLDGLLGAISDIGARAEFPVAGLIADRLAAKRTVAARRGGAHSAADRRARAQSRLARRGCARRLRGRCAAQAPRSRRRGYARGLSEARRLDVMTRTVGVDLLSRALLTSLPPLQAARGIVLHGLNALAPLRRAVMRLGLAPPTELAEPDAQSLGSRRPSRFGP